jgi:hypothetical protein
MDVAVGKMNTPIFMDHLLAYSSVDLVTLGEAQLCLCPPIASSSSILNHVEPSCTNLLNA